MKVLTEEIGFEEIISLMGPSKSKRMLRQIDVLQLQSYIGSFDSKLN